jgi:hypothetical protein
MDGLIDDLSVDEVKKALGVKSKAKTAKKAPKQAEESAWDLAWTVFASLMLLFGRLLKTIWKFRVGVLAGAFIVQNMVWAVNHFHLLK